MDRARMIPFGSLAVSKPGYVEGCGREQVDPLTWQYAHAERVAHPNIQYNCRPFRTFLVQSNIMLSRQAFRPSKIHYLGMQKRKIQLKTSLLICTIDKKTLINTGLTHANNIGDLPDRPLNMGFLAISAPSLIYSVSTPTQFFTTSTL